MSSHQSKLIIKANRLKKFIDLVSRDFDCKHSCLKQTKKVTRLLTNFFLFEDIYERSAIKPVSFLISKTQDPGYTSSNKTHKQCVYDFVYHKEQRRSDRVTF